MRKTQGDCRSLHIWLKINAFNECSLGAEPGPAARSLLGFLWPRVKVFLGDGAIVSVMFSSSELAWKGPNKCCILIFPFKLLWSILVSWSMELDLALASHCSNIALSMFQSSNSTLFCLFLCFFSVSLTRREMFIYFYTANLFSYSKRSCNENKDFLGDFEWEYVTVDSLGDKSIRAKHHVFCWVFRLLLCVNYVIVAAHVFLFFGIRFMASVSHWTTCIWKKTTQQHMGVKWTRLPFQIKNWNMACWYTPALCAFVTLIWWYKVLGFGSYSLDFLLMVFGLWSQGVFCLFVCSHIVPSHGDVQCKCYRN